MLSDKKLQKAARRELLFREALSGMDTDRRTAQMKQYIQHGSTTTYDHCLSVARMSYGISRGLHLHTNERELVRGALLHDYFLYDWHSYRGPLHGVHHPDTALRNAARDFEDLTPRERNIILSHMWPLTPFAVPRSREAALVCLADKLVSIRETLHMRHTTGGRKRGNSCPGTV